MELVAFRSALEARQRTIPRESSESECLYCLMAVINTTNKSTLREKVFICLMVWVQLQELDAADHVTSTVKKWRAQNACKSSDQLAFSILYNPEPLPRRWLRPQNRCLGDGSAHRAIA